MSGRRSHEVPLKSASMGAEQVRDDDGDKDCDDDDSDGEHDGDDIMVTKRIVLMTKMMC